MPPGIAVDHSRNWIEAQELSTGNSCTITVPLGFFGVCIFKHECAVETALPFDKHISALLTMCSFAVDGL